MSETIKLTVSLPIEMYKYKIGKNRGKFIVKTVGTIKTYETITKNIPEEWYKELKKSDKIFVEEKNKHYNVILRCSGLEVGSYKMELESTFVESPEKIKLEKECEEKNT